MDKYAFLALLMFVIVAIATVFFLVVYLDDGELIEPTCFELGGTFCEDICSTDLVSASDGLCCTGECRKPLCSDLSGYICSSESECSGNLLAAYDSNVCCDNQCKSQVSFSECPAFCPYGSLCDKTVETDGSFVCCENSCNIAKTPTCNYNTINEDFEDAACPDSKCNGVVSNGICYNYKGTDCDSVFIPEIDGVYCNENVPSGLGCSVPGKCFNSTNPLIVVFDIPSFYPVGVAETGAIKIKNNGDREITEIISWAYNPKFNITSGNQEIGKVHNSISLGSQDEIIIPISITAIGEHDIFHYPYEIFSTLALNVGNESYQSHWMRIYKKTNQTICGGKTFYMKGVCNFDVFYPDSMCSPEDNYKICSSGFPVGKYLKYDNATKKIRLVPNVPAKGLKKAFFIRINNDFEINVPKMQQEVEYFFDRESMRIISKDMVDFQFLDAGRIDLDWAIANTSEKLLAEIESRLSLNKGDYDFILGYTDRIKSGIDFNDTAGVYLGNGLILVDTSQPIGIMEQIVAHEINHGFGAPDLYYNLSLTYFPIACSAQYINGLMCGGSYFSAKTLSDFVLYTAPFIGWGDMDNDGTIDIEDDEVSKIPSWYEGPQILDALPILPANRPNNFSIDVYVVDKKTQKLSPVIIRISSSLFNIETFSHTGFLSYDPKVFPQNNMTINIDVEYGAYTDTTSFVFDPATYKYRRSKYNDSIHGFGEPLL